MCATKTAGSKKEIVYEKKQWNAQMAQIRHSTAQPLVNRKYYCCTHVLYYVHAILDALLLQILATATILLASKTSQMK